MGEVVVVYEDDKKRGGWKMGVVDGLVIGRDGIVRGATVRVITKGNRFASPGLYKSSIHWSFGAKGREHGHLAFIIATKRFPQERSL